MISIEQINGEIAVLEDEKPTFAVMQKLADLYTVRDHIVIHPVQENPPDNLVSMDSGTEFAQAVSGRDIKEVLAVVDELMSTLQVINPRMYAGVLRKIEGQ
ncbi:MAG: hypothetical protein IJI19_05990 [Ruminococcus sp.]|nr:hypothetical protein [Ruminococcus sp.]